MYTMEICAYLHSLLEGVVPTAKPRAPSHFAFWMKQMTGHDYSLMLLIDTFARCVCCQIRSGWDVAGYAIFFCVHASVCLCVCVRACVCWRIFVARLGEGERNAWVSCVLHPRSTRTALTRNGGLQMHIRLSSGWGFSSCGMGAEKRQKNRFEVGWSSFGNTSLSFQTEFCSVNTPLCS
jgi:hypothetical protein